MASNPMVVRATDEHGKETKINFSEGTITGYNNDGKLVTMSLQPTDVHIDQALATYALGYSNAEFIADKVCPIVSTPKQSDKYWIWDKDDTFQLVTSTSVSPNGTVPEIAPRQSNTSFNTVPYALKTALPIEVEAGSDAALKIAMRYVKLPIEKLMLQREYRVGTTITTAASFASANKTTLGSTTKWNGGSASDPVANLKALCQASLSPINRIVMNERVFDAFQMNAQVQKYIVYKSGAAPQFDPAGNGGTALSSLLELPPIVVARAKYKSATSSYDYVFPNHVALMHLPATMPPVGEACSWNTFRWMGAAEAVPNAQIQTIPGSSGVGGFCVRTFYNPLRGLSGTRECVVFHYDSDVFLDSACSGLVIDAYQ